MAVIRVTAVHIAFTVRVTAHRTAVDGYRVIRCITGSSSAAVHISGHRTAVDGKRVVTDAAAVGKGARYIDQTRSRQRYAFN